MKKVIHWLDEYFEEFLMVLFLAAMTIIMGIQVFSRYILGISLSWSEEITRYLFIWSAFLSVSLCTKKCISIKIDQFIDFILIIHRIDAKHCNIDMRVLHSRVLPVDHEDIVSFEQKVVRNRIDVTQSLFFDI